jgi:hypothetical protein
MERPGPSDLGVFLWVRFGCDGLSQLWKARPARSVGQLLPVIALSGMGLFITIWRIFCAAGFN